jgi:rubrerythrin
MVGVITGWDILANPFATIQAFGWQVFFKAVAPWNKRAFLTVLEDAGLLAATAAKMPAALDRCIGLELRAKRIYTALARAFDDHPQVGPFFRDLASQEQQHADLLRVCQAATVRGGWEANLFSPWEEYLSRLERQMDAAEAAMGQIGSVEDALRLVLEIESSEINQVFEAAFAATGAAFIKRLKPFRQAVELHIAHILWRLPELAPSLMAATRELRARFPQVPS